MRRLGGALAIEAASSPGSSNTAIWRPAPRTPIPVVYRHLVGSHRPGVGSARRADPGRAGIAGRLCKSCGCWRPEGLWMLDLRSCGSWWQGYLGLPLPLAPHLRRPSQPQLTVHQSQLLAPHFPSQQRVVRPRTDDPHAHCVGPPRL